MKPYVAPGLAVLCVALACRAAAEIPLTPCRLASAWLPGVAAECGSLRVAENPAEPAGRSIDLHVARVPSVNAEPRPDPLVVIAGGPGQSAVDFYLSMRGAFEHIRRDREIVLLDQRGTGESAPLACDQADALTLERADTAALPRLMRACLATLAGDPRFYTTSVAVLDLETLRAALGVDAWNLYGVSYGTRVAQHYLRRFPEHTRALLLDGVVPSDAPLGPDVAAQAQRVLEQILERCADDEVCAARFPALAARLDTLLAHLAAEPASITVNDPVTGEAQTRLFTRAELTSIIRLLSYSPQTAALLPLLIDLAHAGRLAPVAAQGEMLARDLETALSLTVHNAVICTEDAPSFAGEPASGEASGYLGTSVVEALVAVCSVWPAGVLDADLRTPLRSDRPVLLMSGDADPITPPAYAERVLAGLGNARHLSGPGQGHGLAGIGCVPRLMRTFLETLDPAMLDASCLERERPSPFFLDFNGPSP